MSKDTIEIVEIKSLRKVLQQFNEDLGQYINAEERFKLGRVLTIIDASIADPEQRKAIKDLVNNEWWGNNHTRVSESTMANPHSDIRGLTEALGFELYPVSDNEPLAEPHDSNQGWIVNRYKNVLTTRK